MNRKIDIKGACRESDRRNFIKKCAASSVFGLMYPYITSFDERDLFESWKQASSMPYALQEIYCAVFKESIHLAGGFIVGEASAGVSKYHLSYDTKKDLWELRADLPEQRHHLQMISHKGKLYGMGGFVMGSSDAGWVMQDQTWAYDPDGDSWEVLSSAPVKHGETVGASIGDRLHLVGGRSPQGSGNAVYSDHKDSDHHLVYDTRGDSWERAAPALKARNSAAGAVIDGSWHVVGGRTVVGGNVNTLEVYDQREDRWRNATPMPRAQGGLAAAAVGGKLYAFGGEYFNNGGGVYKECWCYDPKRDRWDASAPMRTPRHGLAGAALGNRIFAIGGAKKPGGRETSNLVEYWEVIA